MMLRILLRLLTETLQLCFTNVRMSAHLVYLITLLLQEGYAQLVFQGMILSAKNVSLKMLFVETPNYFSRKNVTTETFLTGMGVLIYVLLRMVTNALTLHLSALRSVETL